MNYRKILYSTYVSANKQHLYKNTNKSSEEKNVRNNIWALQGWLPPYTISPQVLDLGCGAGQLLSVFEKLGYKDFTGVDSSLEQIQIAQKHFLQAIQADVFDYLESDQIGTFDLITAFDLLEHFTKDEAIRFLQLIHTRLKVEGSLIIQVPNGDSPYVGSIFWSDLTHETLYTTISLRHLLEACGFTNCQFRERGPIPLGFYGRIRTMLWTAIRQFIKFSHYVETGSPSTKVYSRVLICRATKK